MEVTNYCKKMITELDTWREKAEHIIRELDGVPSCDKEKVLPEIIELHMFIEELCERIERVRRNCQESLESTEIGVTELNVHDPEIYGDEERLKIYGVKD